MQKMFLGILAVALLWSVAAYADETVDMDGKEYPTCKAAEPYAWGEDGKLKLAFVQNCPENARQLSSRPAPQASVPGADAQASAAPQDRLSDAELGQLNGLLARRSEELLGPRQANSYGFVGAAKAHKELPPKDGCIERKVPDYKTRQWMIRVVCITGRHRN